MAAHLSAARGLLQGKKKVPEHDGESVDHLSRYELSFLPPEVRFAHRQKKPPVHPPSPWNPKLVQPVFVGDEKAPFEQIPDQPDEWLKTSQDAGVRRYSAYFSRCNRDGPNLVAGLHPSRSALRPLPSNPTKTFAATSLECRFGVEPAITSLGSAADSLECRPAEPNPWGHLQVIYPDGRRVQARGTFAPNRVPFAGLKDVVPPNSSTIMEGDPVWVTREPKPREPSGKGKAARSKRSDSERDLPGVVADFE
mmetsp:Transcript_30676/g.72898  ORF Transcript_30676/g.72898 Transcript_30676/m.72898 type:complete len:252 (+) Transcript_30676:136-891(+)